MAFTNSVTPTRTQQRERYLLPDEVPYRSSVDLRWTSQEDDPSNEALQDISRASIWGPMPKAIIDELTSLPISRQRRYQLRKRRDRKCIRCGHHAVNEGYFCESHRQVHNVLTRELQRRRFDYKHRDYESESYSFSFSNGRLLYDAANIYLGAGRSNSSPTVASYYLRMALGIGFNAVEAYIKTVTDQFQVRPNKTTSAIREQIEYLFSELSTEPLDQTSSCWQEFTVALKLRDEFQRSRTPSRIDVSAIERALFSIRSLLNTLNNGIYGSRWA